MHNATTAWFLICHSIQAQFSAQQRVIRRISREKERETERDLREENLEIGAYFPGRMPQPHLETFEIDDSIRGRQRQQINPFEWAKETQTFDFAWKCSRFRRRTQFIASCIVYRVFDALFPSSPNFEWLGCAHCTLCPTSTSLPLKTAAEDRQKFHFA